MHRRWMVLSLFVLGTALLVPSANAQGKGKGKNKQAEQEDHRNVTASIVFSSRDRDIIRDYYRGNPSNLPPGLAKRGGNLPPGLQKQLQRNGTLPPGLQKRLTPFPADLERRLPRLPDIYQRGSVGGVFVILDRRTQRILDVIDDILRP